MNKLDLNGRNAVVTGGAAGIGLAIAERLAASGARVSLWDRDEKALAGSAAGLNNAHTARLDVSDSSNGKPMAAMRLIVQATGEPDRVIAKGTIPLGALPEGDFVVRAIVEMEGQPAGRVIRTIRKQIR